MVFGMGLLESPPRKGSRASAPPDCNRIMRTSIAAERPQSRRLRGQTLPGGEPLRAGIHRFEARGESDCGPSTKSLDMIGESYNKAGQDLKRQNCPATRTSNNTRQEISN